MPTGNDRRTPSAEDIFAMGPVIPVLVIEQVEDAPPIAGALLDGGVKVLEITLRTPPVLQIIGSLRREFPEAVVGAGTVTDPETLHRAVEAGAQFLISPGITPRLLDAGRNAPIPLIPGIGTVSELMMGLEAGYTCFKFFPAEAAGGIKMLNAMAGPFPAVRFCPTGGINAANARDYLRRPNVACVGGSWLVTREIIAEKDWPEVTRRCRDILSKV